MSGLIWQSHMAKSRSLEDIAPLPKTARVLPGQFWIACGRHPKRLQFTTLSWYGNLIPATWYQIPGTGYLIPGTSWYQVPGTRYHGSAGRHGFHFKFQRNNKCPSTSRLVLICVSCTETSISTQTDLVDARGLDEADIHIPPRPRSWTRGPGC